MSNRKPTPRTSRTVPSLAHVLLIAIVLFASAWGIYKIVKTYRTFNEQTEKKAVEKSMSSLAPSYLYDGTCVRWYVFIDPETNREYLYNDLGGAVPRTTPDGEQMTASPYSFTERSL